MNATMFHCLYKPSEYSHPPTATLKRDKDGDVWIAFSEDISHQVQVIMSPAQFAAFRDLINALPDASAPAVEPERNEQVAEPLRTLANEISPGVEAL